MDKRIGSYRTKPIHYEDCGTLLTSHRSEVKRCKSCARKYQYATRPETHPMLGKIVELAPNFKDGRSLKQYYCLDCKKEINWQTATIGSGRCHSCTIKGILHPNWIEDRSLLEYSDNFNKELREEIRKRDNYECQNCSMTEEEHLIVVGRILTIHHIDYNKKNSNKNNLITLCTSCNIRANYNRDYWKKIYLEKTKCPKTV